MSDRYQHPALKNPGKGRVAVATYLPPARHKALRRLSSLATGKAQRRVSMTDIINLALQAIMEPTEDTARKVRELRLLAENLEK